MRFPRKAAFSLLGSRTLGDLKEGPFRATSTIPTEEASTGLWLSGVRCVQRGSFPLREAGATRRQLNDGELIAALKKELICRHRFKTRDEVRPAVFRYVEGFYNLKRRYRALGYKSPEEYERMFTETVELFV